MLLNELHKQERRTQFQEKELIDQKSQIAELMVMKKQNQIQESQIAELIEWLSILEAARVPTVAQTY